MAEYSAIYETAIERIQSSFNSCSPAEQKMMLDILQEMSKTGYSYTLENLWLSDFKEIPVGLDQFLNDPDYLGGATNGGKSVYPYWRDMMNKLFNAGNMYNEIILSGATRIGKTSTAVTILAYMLYKLMLYRDPHTYFDKKPTARFTLIFANLTKELANGVAFFEFNSTIKESPWFLRHGSMNKSTSNPVYLPEGDKINILPVSDSAHALGMQVWCITGQSYILTKEGPKKIEDCSGTFQSLAQLDNNNLLTYSDALVAETGVVRDTIRITFEDGSIIEGTPEHMLMLKDGSYKQLQYLEEGDDIMEVEQWRDIPGYEGRYQASNFGRIRSLYRGTRLLRQYESSYPTVSLSYRGIQKDAYVPELVLMAFHGMDSISAFYHADSNVFNNYLSNLRLGHRNLGPDWKPVPGTGDIVFASKSGQIYSRTYTYKVGTKIYTSAEHIVNQLEDYGGYLYVDIARFPELHFVHKIVARTFIEDKEGFQVNHIDGNKHNNSVTNLEWVTSKQNIEHAFRTGLRDIRKDIDKCREMSKSNQKKVRCITTGQVFDSITAASVAFNMSNEGIRERALKGGPTRRGLEFEFVNPEDAFRNNHLKNRKQYESSKD